jgi:proteasome lid subunit RPN8/RPN11
MMPVSTLSFAGILHERVRAHLFPGDGFESAAILLCSRTPGPRLRLLVREAILVPYADCRREPQSLTWPGHYIEDAIDRAERDQLVIILLHSHPGGFFDFSDVDNRSDQAAIPSLVHAFGDLHGSAVMVPGGAIRARLYGPDLVGRPVDLVSIVGHDLRFWWEMDARVGTPSHRPLAFTSDMRSELGRLSAGVIGLSGTGSVGGESLARIGFGRVKAIEFDVVELRNLDRILNSTSADAVAKRLKVDVYAEAVARYRGEGVVEKIAASVLSRKAVLAASQCDVLFCNVDTLEARQVADLISSAFLIPLFDVGVTIPVRQAGESVAIADVCGRIDYVQPGRSTLRDRGVYTAEGLRAEYLRKVAADDYAREIREGYFKGLIDEAPAVITLNMRAASACVNEFVARAYPFRLERNERYARTAFSLAACEEEYMAEGDFVASPNPLLARGAQEPLLGLPALALREASSTGAKVQKQNDAPHTLVA